jgi:ATP-dependent DNA helicase RecQ
VEETGITIYTIGHGRQSIESFLSLLRLHQIDFVCDVRSAARSRWPQYNGPALAEALLRRGIGYEHLPECGGKVIAPPAELARGIARILELGAELRVAMMCSESQPLTRHVRRPRANCHRVGLLAAPLRARGARITHILPDGRTTEFDEAEVPSIWS